LYPAKKITFRAPIPWAKAEKKRREIVEGTPNPEKNCPVITCAGKRLSRFAYGKRADGKKHTASPRVRRRGRRQSPVRIWGKNILVGERGGGS